LHDDRDDTHNDLADIEDPLAEEAEHGRIGYGRLGEWTPYFLAAAIILTIVIIAAVSWLDDDDDSPPDDQTTTEAVANGPAPTFTTTLVNGNGEEFDLTAYRGKVVVVNFWATWCEPCKDEMPAMQQLATNNADVVVIGIAEPFDEAGDVQSFANDLGVTYPLAIDKDGNGPSGAIASSFQVFGYPATFFIDAEGNLVDSIFGPFPLEDLQAYVDRARSTTAG
jgi:thiol-disulfide isomerase/thioredoxin